MQISTFYILILEKNTSMGVFGGVEFDSGLYFGRGNFCVAMDTGFLFLWSLTKFIRRVISLAPCNGTNET